MATPPRKRPYLGGNDPQVHKRVRTADKGEQSTTKESASSREAPGTPSPSVGAKCAGTDMHSNNDDKPEQAINTRAIYDANKDEVDEWYDEDYSRKQGIPLHGKMLRSNHRWYQKVAAWMKFKGMFQSPKKKRKLNDGTPLIGEVQRTRPLRPDEIRYPNDVVSVPEYPLDSLKDYTPMDNGRYVCSHVHLEPPKDCCKFGLTKDAKRQSIKKGILRWKANVEKLIDKKQLDKQHRTWTDWTVPELRKKHQRALWDSQEAKKQADMRWKKKDDERRRAREQAEMDVTSVPQTANQQAVQRSPTIQRSAPVTSPRPQAYSRPIVSASSSVVFSAAQPSAVSQPQRPIAPTRHQSDPNTIASTQSAFLTNLAHTKPRLLRSYEAFYHDAQYRENLKEHPDFARLRKWYLAYFLKQQRQPLNAEQRTLLESGDPSYNGKKRMDGALAMEKVDVLFGEHIRAAKAAKAEEQPKKSSMPVRPQASTTSSPTLSQPLTLPTVRAESPAQADVQNLDDLFEDAVVAPTVVSEIESASHAAFEIWDYERTDRELDRILEISPIYTTQPAVGAIEPLSQDAGALRTEFSYITMLPQAFATGNETVDDEMQQMLEYAYQTESTSQHLISEDEQLLRQTIEDCRPDWQRYCGFFDDEQTVSGSPAPAEQPVVGEFNFGEPLSDEQLAMFDFDDPVGQQLFAQHDERVAAAHAANLARYR